MRKICATVLLLVLLCSCSTINDGEVISPTPSPTVPYITGSSYDVLLQLTEAEITKENFDKYFAFTFIENPVDVFGNPLPAQEYDYYVVTSKVYTDGLVFYGGRDIAVEFDCGTDTVAASEYYIRLSCPKDVAPKLKTVKGSCTFADKSTVEEYFIKDGYRCVRFADGKLDETESRDIMAQYPY